MKVISWNTLSPDLFTEDKYNQYYDLKKITPKFRLKKTCAILKKYSKKYDIILLQEVNNDWYYNKGIQVLLQNSVFENSTNHGLVTGWNSKKFLFINKYKYLVNEYIEKYLNQYKENEQAVKKKKDISIVVLFDLIKKQNIFIVNYHFPNFYNFPTAMQTHSRAVIKIIKEVLVIYNENISTANIIIGTDANSTPKSKVVLHFCKNGFQKYNHNYNHTTYNHKNDWNGQSNAFSEILDYFFLSRSMKINKFEVLLYSEKQISPNLKNPSDHNPLMIEVE